jgi:hypothetical protein
LPWEQHRCTRFAVGLEAERECVGGEQIGRHTRLRIERKVLEPDGRFAGERARAVLPHLLVRTQVSYRPHPQIADQVPDIGVSKLLLAVRAQQPTRLGRPPVQRG